MSPFQRFVRLLKVFSPEITYLVIYAVISGLISLTLPLGIQAIIGFVSGGMINSSWYILVALVTVGLGIAGVLKLLQLRLGEVIKRRIFAFSSIEFTLRIQRFAAESLRGIYTPELINRFFDTLTIQKILPKLLMEYAAAALTTFFGLLLLAFYHPVFILLGVIIVLSVWIIFKAFAADGMSSSIAESKLKYKLVHWLEELGRALPAFQHYDARRLSMTKSDGLVQAYLDKRTDHFRVLFSQHVGFLIFKLLITAGMLLLGGILVSSGDINLGQFVAAEIVVLQLVNSLEKLVDSWEDLYDMLTATEKLGEVYDMPMESNGGLDLPAVAGKGMAVRLNQVSYQPDSGSVELLQGLDLDIPAGSRLGIIGYPSSGRSALMHILSRTYHGFEGLVEFDGQNVRQLNLDSTRRVTGDLLSRESLFAGTILENIVLQPGTKEIGHLMSLLVSLGLSDTLSRLPQGILSPVLPAGRNLPKPLCARILLCRALVHQPRLLLLEDLLHDLNLVEKMAIMRFICDRKHPWTVVSIVDSCEVAALMDHLIIMQDGRIVASGQLEELKGNPHFQVLMRY